MAQTERNRIKKLKTKLFLGVAAASMASIGGSAASAESLMEALAAAYASNPQLEAQRAALRATDEGVRRAKSSYLPAVSAFYSETEGERESFLVNDDGDPIDGGGNLLANTPGFLPTDRDSYGLQADQTLFRGLRTHNEIQQAKANVYVGRAQLTQVEQQVLLDAVTAYMDVYRDMAVFQLNQSNVQVLERQLQASRDRFRVGEITRTDVAQSEARLEVSKAQLLTAEARLETSRATYARIVGRMPAGLEAPMTALELPADLEAAVDLAQSEAPDVQLARHAEEAARKGIHVAQGSLLPTVTLRGEYLKSNGTQFIGPTPVQAQAELRQVTLNVNIPLYTGGANHSDVRRAKQVRSQRMLEIRQAERVVQERVFTAWNQYRAAKGQILSGEAAVKANEIALEGVRQEAAVGSRTTLDVLDAEQELLDSRVSLTRSRRDESVAAYTLLSSVGQLTARKLALDVEIYDPEINYKKVRNKIAGW